MAAPVVYEQSNKALNFSPIMQGLQLYAGSKNRKQLLELEKEKLALKTKIWRGEEEMALKTFKQNERKIDILGRNADSARITADAAERTARANESRTSALNRFTAKQTQGQEIMNQDAGLALRLKEELFAATKDAKIAGWNKDKDLYEQASQKVKIIKDMLDNPNETTKALGRELMFFEEISKLNASAMREMQAQVQGLTLENQVNRTRIQQSELDRKIDNDKWSRKYSMLDQISKSQVSPEVQAFARAMLDEGTPLIEIAEYLSKEAARFRKEKIDAAKTVADQKAKTQQIGTKQATAQRKAVVTKEDLATYETGTRQQFSAERANLAAGVEGAAISEVRPVYYDPPGWGQPIWSRVDKKDKGKVRHIGPDQEGGVKLMSRKRAQDLGLEKEWLAAGPYDPYTLLDQEANK